MIDNPSRDAHPGVHGSEGSLVRADLLRAALQALIGARAFADQAPRSEQSVQLLERLDAHQEILARRAANVALAPTVTAEELQELRGSTAALVFAHGAVARRLAVVGRAR